WLAMGTRGMLADFAAFDEHEEGLADFLVQFPQLKDTVVEVFAKNENDSVLTGRLKNAFEGFGLGVATDGLIIALKGLRKVRVGRAMQRTMQAVEGDPKMPRSVRVGELEALGDPSQGLFIKRTTGKLQDALDETAGMKPS